MTSNTPYIEALLKDYKFEPALLERVSFRKNKIPLHVVEPDPAWPQQFEDAKSQIISAIGDKAVLVSHVGSTSIPDMPAKPVIDIDLTVSDIRDEPSYVPQLEAAGFQFLSREPHWHEHRFFTREGPVWVNLHVWGPGSPEVERHQIFRNWILDHPEDKELYLTAKKEASAHTVAAGETLMDYNLRKEGTIQEILKRAFRERGYMQ